MGLHIVLHRDPNYAEFYLDGKRVELLVTEIVVEPLTVDTKETRVRLTVLPDRIDITNPRVEIVTEPESPDPKQEPET